MPKLNSKYYNSSFLHIMVQGINKEEIFKNSIYKNLYKKLLKQNSKQYNLNLLAYAIMDNHTHILIFHNNIKNVSKYMYQINKEYAQIYNKYEERVGYVFRDRYKCEQITDRKYLYNALAYIHFNPYRAGIVKKLSSYKYSSYKEFILGDVSRENILLIFEEDNYKQIFIDIHKRYFKRITNYNEFYKVIIEEFLEENKFKTLEDIKKNNNKLLKLIEKLKIECKMTNSEICKILKLGKNRITNLIKSNKV